MPFIPTRDMIAANAANLMIRDAINPGDTAFDVGAFGGSLTALMSRLVGPLGTVIAFEADERNLENCLTYLRQAGTTNYIFVNAAVCERVSTVTFFPSALEPLDRDDCTAIDIASLSLDAYISENNLQPALIKVAIAGGELRVLEGARDYIKQAVPILVLEQQPRDKRCARFLEEFGYFGIDAYDYRPFNDREYPPERMITDVLFFRPGGAHGFTPETFRSKTISEVADPHMYISGDGERIQSPNMELEAGRYVLGVDYKPGPGNGAISQRIKADGRPLSVDDGGKHWIWDSYRRIPFHLHTRSCVTLEYQALEPGAVQALQFSRIRVDEIPGLGRALKMNER